jgi:hypothetical protein
LKQEIHDQQIILTFKVVILWRYVITARDSESQFKYSTSVFSGSLKSVGINKASFFNRFLGWCSGIPLNDL